MPCTVFIATSLDGFIARRDGDIDWLAAVEAEGEDYGYAKFMETVDALVMGRGTFDKVADFPEWPYGTKPVYVLTNRPLDLPKRLQKAGTVSAICGAPHEVVQQLAANGCERLYIDGGITIQQFLEAGLIDRLIISQIPVLLGEGIPLFGPLSEDVKLRHMETQHFASGLVQSTYDIAPNN